MFVCALQALRGPVRSGVDGAGLKLLAGFIFCYAPLRFVLEFLRGDADRGVLFGVSVSQVISVVMLAWAVWLWRRGSGRQAAPDGSLGGAGGRP